MVGRVRARARVCVWVRGDCFHLLASNDVLVVMVSCLVVIVFIYKLVMASLTAPD